MKFRVVHKINLATVKRFRLQTSHYGTIGPTALERDVFNNYRQTRHCYKMCHAVSVHLQSFLSLWLCSVLWRRIQMSQHRSLYHSSIRLWRCR